MPLFSRRHTAPTPVKTSRRSSVSFQIDDKDNTMIPLQTLTRAGSLVDSSFSSHSSTSPFPSISSYPSSLFLAISNSVTSSDTHTETDTMNTISPHVPSLINTPFSPDSPSEYSNSNPKYDSKSGFMNEDIFNDDDLLIVTRDYSYDGELDGMDLSSTTTLLQDAKRKSAHNHKRRHDLDLDVDFDPIGLMTVESSITPKAHYDNNNNRRTSFFYNWWKKRPSEVSV